MAYHLVVDECRYSRRRVPVEEVDFRPGDRVSALVMSENRFLIKMVLEAIQNHLTANQRHLIILRFLEGMSLEETSTIMGKTSTRVKVIQNRAIAKLRQLLEHHPPKSILSL
jgi:RNA polymerase sigma factor (sigma-70 family)